MGPVVCESNLTYLWVSFLINKVTSVQNGVGCILFTVNPDWLKEIKHPGWDSDPYTPNVISFLIKVSRQ